MRLVTAEGQVGGATGALQIVLEYAPRPVNLVYGHSRVIDNMQPLVIDIVDFEV